MNYRFETNAIRTQTERSDFLEHSTSLYITSSFIFEDAEEMRASFAEEKERNIYSRFSNPNTSEFIEKMFDKKVNSIFHNQELNTSFYNDESLDEKVTMTKNVIEAITKNAP